jgi:hypothetical protein
MYFLLVNCDGCDMGGRNLGSTSDNFFTSHDFNIVGIDIAGYSLNARGGSCRSVQYAQGWLVGTLVVNDLGDVMNGGVQPPTAFQTDNSATYWLDSCTANMQAGTRSIYTSAATATINYRNFSPTSGSIGGTGTVSPY